MNWRSAIVFLLAGCVYLNSLGGDFVSDDRPLILEHPYTKSLQDLPAIFTAGHYAGTGGYRPLTTASFALNYFVGGTNPRGYHVVSVLLHALISLLVYLLVVRLFRSPNAALIAGLLFAVHPIHTEAVAWISGRAELLAAFFALGSWWFYLRGKFLVALALFFVGCLSKENALMLPFFILAGDIYLARRDGQSLHPKLKYYAAFVGVIAFYFAFRWTLYAHTIVRRAGHIAFYDNPLASAEPTARILTALKILGEYFQLLVWPWHLVADYSFNVIPVVHGFADAGLIVAVVLILALVAVASASFVRRGSLWLPVAISFVAIAPTANLALSIGTIKAERLLYLPSVGFCMVIGLLAARLRSRLMTASIVAVACLLLTFRTWKRNQDWRSEVSLWSATTRTAPQNFRAQMIVGAEYLHAGALQEAIVAYRNASTIDPDSEDAQLNLGAALVKAGRLTEAIQLYQDAIRAHPQQSSLWLNLGFAFAARGDMPAAIENFRHAIGLKPDNAVAHLNLGVAVSQMGNKEEALEHYQRAVELKPDYAEGWNALGAILLKLDRKNEAREALARALSLRPGYPEATYNLSLLDQP